MPPRMLPEPTPETRHFWDGCKEGELRLQRCTSCQDSYFPPRPFCPKCGNRVQDPYPSDQPADTRDIPSRTSSSVKKMTFRPIPSTG